MGKKEDKTNVMRVLDSRKIDYRYDTYNPEIVNAVEVALSLNINQQAIFKTLVTVGKSKEHYVFMVPSCEELNLKKAAKAAGEKNIEMIPQKDLRPLTGYIHGGCSPIGMKKKFKTFINRSAADFDEIYFSGGKIGHQVIMKPDDLTSAFDIEYADLV